MICRPRAAAIPMVFAVRLGDRQVIDRGDTPAHQAVLVELPVLVAVGPEPVRRIVMPFVGKAHGDAIAARRPDLLDQPVVELFGPFARKESLDGGAALKEFRAVPPYAAGRVGQRDAFRIATVPGILGGSRLYRRRFGREGRERWTWCVSIQGSTPSAAATGSCAPDVVRPVGRFPVSRYCCPPARPAGNESGRGRR